MPLFALKGRLSSRTIFTVLITLQLIILVGTYLHARTSLLWIWAISSYIPAVTVCLFTTEKRYALPSLLILFISQQAIFIFANPTWGLSYGSDPINDFHTASVLSEEAHFELGQAGYAGRPSYSYYPMLHLFSVALGNISGIPLVSIVLYFVPILNALLTTFSLFHLNQEFFGLGGRERNLATLFFEMSFAYTNTDSQFVREAFAFPFVLLSLWAFTRIVRGRSRQYAIIALIFVITVTLSHHISSYLFLVILAIMAVSFKIFQRSNRLNKHLFLTATLLAAYTSFVTLDFSMRQAVYAFEGIQAIFLREALPTIMKPYASWRVYLSYIHYVILSAFALVGGLKVLREKRKNWVVVTVLAFFAFSFLLCVALRLSTPADPWSWTYYMSLRGTTWAFLGISVAAVIGINYFLKLDNVRRKSFLALLLVICILAAGKFSQFSPIVTDPTIAPVNYPRYVAASWLKERATHGSNMLVAPYTSDPSAFEASRDMAPYAYLRVYFLDTDPYDMFSGYIPFVGGFFDQYKSEPDVQIIYSNGDVEVGVR